MCLYNCNYSRGRDAKQEMPNLLFALLECV